MFKPGETITGFGVDFFNLLATSETIAAAEVTASAGLTVSSINFLGTIVTCQITVSSTTGAANLYVLFTVVGSSGSRRKVERMVKVQPLH